MIIDMKVSNDFMPHRKKSVTREIVRHFWLLVGAVITAAGLELFLVPNQIIDGGIVGISIMASYLIGWPLGIFVILLNLPFLYIGYKQIGQTFAASTLFAIIILAFSVFFFHSMPVVTTDLFLAAVFGGVIVGMGVGIIIRSGGSLDGTEIIAIIVDKRMPFSVGEIIMFFNLFILISAGFVFAWDKAMYSLVAYFVAFKVIDMTIEGLDESKGVIIVTNEPDEIASALLDRLGRGVTVFYGAGAYSGEDKKILYSVVTRLEIAKLKSIVQEKDENSFVTIHDVHDVMGGLVKKKAIH